MMCFSRSSRKINRQLAEYRDEAGGEEDDHADYDKDGHNGPHHIDGFFGALIEKETHAIIIYACGARGNGMKYCGYSGGVRLH
ncbi:MAG: hypothetical protein UY70_C0009G0003 [Candidatus Kaiserbacteria bacterium GW2011_GWB1_52_6]|uniref:Uncharacterized protein n=3 Tax=Candidatus Kaiseribacteriota TaxID=1752734 RepID=A0A0G1XJQ0_9BACT|nr:MAG: hypothetical protein UY67_C0012G0002 [Candidatus Kaiserbacteria bacterium GW2011_GWA2_52_12]KKW27677.1 MAG: hypothetical protein UY70_C0009G0003 [Candidatus Kaiserbacteria bacterium GW2011_GWB1_52_6]KKW31463.1 MAG: hypothetical protein UY74_C0013G0002 [Candidatus Kaiserbacteria bacterium GW2011_GWC2_52_8b]